MRITAIAALIACCLAAAVRPAEAQQSGFTPQQLDEMSRQRQQAVGPRDWGPPPPQSSLPKENFRPPVRCLCASVRAPGSRLCATQRVGTSDRKDVHASRGERAFRKRVRAGVIWSREDWVRYRSRGPAISI